jgi:putative tributyrin esterase
MATFQLNFLSREIGQMTNLSIILPSLTPADPVREPRQAYPEGVRYPVLWLLHDAAGDDADFIKYSNIVRLAEACKLIVIMPFGYNKCYTDAPGSSRYFSYVVNELPRLCRAYFPLSHRREDNFIGGIGMGADGALKAAFTHPEQYSVALSLSGSLGRSTADSTWLAYDNRQRQEGRMLAAPPADASAAEQDLPAMARQAAAQGRPLPKIIMAWGKRDPLTSTSAGVGVQLLHDAGYDVQAFEYPAAGSDWDFWDQALRSALTEWLPFGRAAADSDRPQSVAKGGI